MPFAKMFQAHTEGDMDAVAAQLAPLCTPGRLLALEGNLGAGKTALARALIRHISGQPEMDIPSPTFTLVQTYETPTMPIWHFDFYRLKSPEEVFELGWEDALAANGLIIMEWAERLGPYLPAAAMQVTLTPQPDGTREIEVRA